MDGTEPEVCAACGFDSSHWRLRDVESFQGELGDWWDLATTGIPEDDLNQRPGENVWSALEYGLHSATALAVLREDIQILHRQCHAKLPEVDFLRSIDGHDHVHLDRDRVIEDLRREGQALAALARQGSAPWSNQGVWPDGTAVQAEAVLYHAVHDASHHMMDVSNGFARIRAGTPRSEGLLAQISVSSGGVPKTPVSEAAIGRDGVEGDRQADRKHHGRPFQAVCLWSAEVIGGLAAAGHPIEPGAAGENLTVTGVAWSSLRPGSVVTVGSARLEVSFPATPCHKQRRWFVDGDFGRISHDRNPDLTRWYAWVRQSGNVRVGDAVVVQP